MGIATEIETSIDAFLNTAISSKSALFCSALMPIAASAITIYIFTMGYAVMRGETNDSVSTITWRIFGLALITGIALNAGAYQTMVVDFLQGIQGAFISIVNGASVTTVGGMIDNAVVPFDTLGQQLWSQGNTGVVPKFGLLFAAAIVAVAELVLFAIGLGTYLLSKVAFALILAIGPVFIFLAAFPSTKRFTESWLGQALGFALTNALIAVAFSLFGEFVNQFAADMAANTANTTTVLKDCVSLLLICISLSLVLWNIDTIASALAGGSSINGIGSSIARGLMNMGRGKKEKDPDPNPKENTIKPSVTERFRNAASNVGSMASNVYKQGQALYQRGVLDNLKK